MKIQCVIIPTNYNYKRRPYLLKTKGQKIGAIYISQGFPLLVWELSIENNMYVWKWSSILSFVPDGKSSMNIDKQRHQAIRARLPIVYKKLGKKPDILNIPFSEKDLDRGHFGSHEILRG